VRQLDRTEQAWDDGQTEPMTHAPVHIPSSSSMRTSPRVNTQPEQDADSEDTTLLETRPPAIQVEQEAPTPLRQESAVALPLRPYVPPPFVPPLYPAASNPRNAPTVKRRSPRQLRIALICGAAGALVFIMLALALFAYAFLR
jgi:hypothetical protein